MIKKINPTEYTAGSDFAGNRQDRQETDKHATRGSLSPRKRRMV